MARVWECTLDDLPDLQRLARLFNTKYYDVPLDEGKLYAYLHSLVTNPVGVCYRTEHGAITGVLSMDPLRDWSVLVETAWFCEARNEGVALLRAFENCGLELGVDEIRMTTLSCNPGPASLLARRGYKPIETSHRLLL